MSGWVGIAEIPPSRRNPSSGRRKASDDRRGAFLARRSVRREPPGRGVLAVLSRGHVPPLDTRDLVVCHAVEFASRPSLPDAAPLLEEERDARAQALVA